MIRQAALAGATIVKFQLGHYTGCRTPDPIQSMRVAPMNWAPDLKEWCDYWGVEFMASVFSMSGLRVARSIGQERYKFPSRVAFASHSDEDYDELLLRVLELKKETFVSDPGFICTAPLFRRLYCVPRYPTYPGQVNIPQHFGLGVWYYGYSSHVHGYADALVAVVRGAKYVEKHVTLSKVESSIKDNSFALSFGEFTEMVKVGNEIARLV